MSNNNKDKGKGVKRPLDSNTSRFDSRKGFDPTQRTLSGFFSRPNRPMENQTTISSTSESENEVNSRNVQDSRNKSSDLGESSTNASQNEATQNGSDRNEVNESPINESTGTGDEDLVNGGPPTGSYLEKYFKELTDRLSKESYPSEYRRGTFWIEPKMPFFALKEKAPVDHLYRPRVFLWVPHVLLPDKLNDLKCEKCNSKLATGGYNRPRKVVDLSSCFYVISMKYNCPIKGCKNYLTAHNPKIMHKLPFDLQMEFPAIFTHRLGVSNALVDLLRPCIQNSIGPERFENLLTELHHLRHDRLELQYLLNCWKKRSNANQFGNLPTPKPKPFSTFDDQQKYAGYVPTDGYIRTLYTTIMDELKPKMDKHMMLLDGKVLKGDHSFKFTKHMAKIDETSIFTALYTMTNEYEEIIHQTLVPSKSLSYLKFSVEKMRDAYVDYGYEMPVVFFTDNVTGGKSFLEDIFPSLTDGVRPVTAEEIDSFENVEYLALPGDVDPEYLNRDATLINNRLTFLLESIKNSLEEGMNEVVLRFDCEWKVDPDDSNRVDVVQIAYDKIVYVIHLDSVWHSLPEHLLKLLEDESIKKVGRQLGGDFGRLNRRFGIECKNSFELGAFCSERNYVATGTASLSDIALHTLGYSISKKEQVGSWECDRLTDAQIRYAAIDAWASLEIYKVVNSAPIIGSRVMAENCLPGTFVAFKPVSLSHPAAFGEIIEAENNNNDSVRVRIAYVAAPGYLLQLSPALNNLESNESQVTISSFGEPPFGIDIPRVDLVIESKAVVLLSPRFRNNNISNPSISNNNNRPAATEELLDITETSETEAERVFSRIFEGDSNVDKDSFLLGYKLLEGLNFASNGDEERIYSRIIKDIFHLMDMIKPYKRHGLYDNFTIRFSDSLFSLDQDDKRKVEAALVRHGEFWENKWKYDRKWVLKRVKRRVSPPVVLVPLLKSLFLSFGPLKSEKSGRTLFDKLTWKQAQSVLSTVQRGHVSDPPGIQLYFKSGYDSKYGLTTYRCIRGTPSLEGGVHQNLIRCFGSFGAGPELASAMLTEYRLRHNLNVGTMNRYGYKYEGHYNPWLIQHIHLFRQMLEITPSPEVKHLAIDVNATKYRGSKEIYGISPLPGTEMSDLGIEGILL